MSEINPSQGKNKKALHMHCVLCGRPLRMTRLNALTKEYSSGDDVLNLEDTVALLKKHKLMLEDVNLAPNDKLLR